MKPELQGIAGIIIGGIVSLLALFGLVGAGAFDTEPVSGVATHYGTFYQNSPLGCSGAGLYDTNDISVIAVAPAQYLDWPCGTVLEVCHNDICITGTRRDSCPGCVADQIDLSEAGLAAICPGLDICDVEITRQ